MISRPNLLIPKVAEELKKRKEIQPPVWAAFAKAGVHQQMPPEEPDWWFIRAASVLRRLYIDGPVGVQRMRTAYGGKRDRGSSPFQFRKGGGLVPPEGPPAARGRRATWQRTRTGGASRSPGRSFLDGVAHGLRKNAEEKVAGLSRY